MSPGAETVVACLTPDNASPEGFRAFIPSGFLPADLRISDGDTLHTWFRRIVQSSDTAETIGRHAINEQFAFFGHIDWRDRQIQHCCFQALITVGGTLEEFYHTGNTRANYYRLDMDLSRLGDLFTHPQPHIHSNAHDAPRFPFAWNENEYILISFLEFLFLNHFHNSWLQWAEVQSKTQIAEETFEEIVNCFLSGTIATRIDHMGQHLDRLKAALRRAKAQRIPNPMPLAPACRALSY